MTAAMKFENSASFPKENISTLASGWFWKMTVREWAFAEVDVTDSAIINAAFTGETNNMSVVRQVSTKGGGAKRVTIRFYAYAQGQAYVYLHDPTVSDHYASVDKLLMQVGVEPRSANKPEEMSLTRLDGITAVVNSPDTHSYDMSSTQTFNSKNPVDLVKDIPGGANHIIVASHGKPVGGNLCMFVGGAEADSLRIGLDNVEVVFSEVKKKAAADSCVVWLGGCRIGENNEFCKKAAKASNCPVIAATSFLPNTRFKKGYIEILDRHSSPKLFLPGEDKPSKISDFCLQQEKYKFVVPV